MKRLKLLPAKIRLTDILIYLWLALLLGTILVSARTAYRESLSTEEYAFACDSFGYLRMAREIRRTGSEWTPPQFKLESEQTRLLIDLMRARNVPLSQWDEVVAPHAHHYFPKSGYVGVQYPPGTGLALAVYPEGQAVYRLNLTVVVVLVLTGVASLIIAAYRKAWASAVLLVLAIHLGLAILTRMGALSFSINASLVPILLSCILSVVAVVFDSNNRRRLALISALGAGLFLGFATLVRLPTILLAPGFLLLLWPKSWRTGIRGLPLAFAVGVFVVGIVPVLVHQQAITGAWYRPTYANIDTEPATTEKLKENISYYFGRGPAADDNWAILFAMIGFCAFAVVTSAAKRSVTPDRVSLSRKRVGLAATVMWLLPTVYVVTHWVTGPHYAIAGIFGAVSLFGFGSLALESTARASWQGSPKSMLRLIAVALILGVGLATFNRAWSKRSHKPAPSQAVAHAPIVVPAELTDARSWVWADLLTGTFWYYANKPAFKIQFTNPEMRAMIFRFVFDRGERQYIVQDSERMQKFMDEIVQLGGSLEERGKIDGHPYFLVKWPQGGPAVPKVAD